MMRHRRVLPQPQPPRPPLPLQLIPLLLLLVQVALISSGWLVVALVQATDQDAGNLQRAARNSRQVVWDFGRQPQQVSGPNGGGGPRFAIEPPALVEYLNSTGAVIGCRPTSDPPMGHHQVAPPPDGLKAAKQLQFGQATSISWRQLIGGQLPTVGEHEQPQERELASVAAPAPLLALDEETGSSAADQQPPPRQRRYVRQDGALVLGPIIAGGGGGQEEAAAAAAAAVYRCCLSNKFGSLCSRPVRTRAVFGIGAELPTPPPPTPPLPPSQLPTTQTQAANQQQQQQQLEVFDELALPGNSALLGCRPAEPSLQKYLEPTHWLKDDKIIATAAAANPAGPKADERARTKKYLMLATGQLLIRNVSRLSDGKSTFKCRARHRLSGATFSTKLGGQIMIDDAARSAAATAAAASASDAAAAAAAGQRRQPKMVWARENSDTLFCAEFSAPQPLAASEFVWFFEPGGSQQQQQQQQQLVELSPSNRPEIEQLDSCLLVRQVQLKHAGQYICQAKVGHPSSSSSSGGGGGGGTRMQQQPQRASVRLALGSARLTAQLQLTSGQSGQLEPIQQQQQQQPRSSQFASSISAVQFGAGATLNCSISGFPYDSIAWFKDSRLIAVSSSPPPPPGDDTTQANATTSGSQLLSATPRDSSSNLRLIAPTVIAIERFSPKDTGIYQCQVYSSRVNDSSTGGGGDGWQLLAERDQLRAASGSLQLEIVSSKPNLVNKFQTNLDLIRGSPVSLQCSAFGYPTPRFIWFQDGIPIRSSWSSSSADLSDLDDNPTPDDDFLAETIWDETGANGDFSPSIDPELRDVILSNILGSSGGGGDRSLSSNQIEYERFRIVTFFANNVKQQQQDQSTMAVPMLVVSQLNISQMEPSEIGAYKCLAFNSLGHAQHSAYLSIGRDEPELGGSGGGQLRIERRQYQPTNVTLIAGRSASLQCPLIGHPLTRIDWFRNNQRLPANHRQRVEPINRLGFGGQLELTKVDRQADGGVYSCRAARQTSALASSNSSAAAAAAAEETYDDDLVGQLQVEVRQAPLIDGQSLPELVHTNEGMRTKLVCSVVQGDHPMEIHWLRRAHDRRQLAQVGRSRLLGFELLQRESTGGGSDDNPLISVHNLEDSSLLTFRQISYTDSGDYLCLAQNKAGRSSRLTRVVVNVAPSWSLEPPSQVSVLLGARLQIDCAAHGFPEPSIEWRRRRSRQLSNGSQQQLIGNNDHQQQQAADGSAAAAAAAASQDAFVDLANNYKRRQFTNGSLIIEQSDQSDAGFYMCEISNGIGGGLSKVIRVQVNVAPYFKHQQQQRTSSSSSSSSGSIHLGQVGSRAELKCIAFGDQPMIVGWRKDANDVVDLVNDQRHRLVGEHKLSSQALESQLTIDNLTRADSGQYVCIASNEFGSEETRLQLIVQEPPEAPTLMRPIRAGSRQATISFRPPYSGNSLIKKYAIYYKQLAGGGGGSGGFNETISMQPFGPSKAVASDSNNLLANWQQTLVDSPLTMLNQLAASGGGGNSSEEQTQQQQQQQLLMLNEDQQLVNLNLCCLQPYTRYLVRVRAINELGQGEPSKAVQLMTDEEAIGGPPLDVGVEPTGAHSLKVRWRPPARSMQNGLIRGYYIGYRVQQPSQGILAAAGNLQPLPPSLPMSSQIDLNGDQQYQYKNVQLDLQPVAPSGNKFGRPGLDLLSLNSLTIDDFELSQQHGSGSNSNWPWAGGDLNGPAQNGSATGGGGGPTHQLYTSYLTNLKRKTAYSIIVQAYNKVGAGPRSDQIIVSTLDAAPPMSPILRLVSVGYNSAQFTWSSRRFRLDSNESMQAQPTPPQQPSANHLRPALIIDEAALINDDGGGGGDSSDDPQSYYTLNFRAEPLSLGGGGGGGASGSGGAIEHEGSRDDWQQRRLAKRAHLPYVLNNLKCGSRYLAFMTATNSLGQSEPGESVRFLTLGAAPIAPKSSRDFLQVNSSYVVLRLGLWQNAGCPISSFIVKYKTLGQLKWTVLEHQVQPTIQTIVIAGSALFSTRQSALAGAPLAGGAATSRSLAIDSYAEADSSQAAGKEAPGRLGSRPQPNLNDFIIRNLAINSEYKLLVEANSEAGSTLAEYEFETANFSSSLLAVSVNGVNAADLVAFNGGLNGAGGSGDGGGGNQPAAGGAADSSSLDQGGGGELLDFNYNGGQRGGLASTVGGPLQRYAIGVWSLTALFVVGSIFMALATLILGFRSIMRIKPMSSSSSDSLISAMLCCSGSSSARSSSSENGGSSHSSSGGGTCYQLAGDLSGHHHHSAAAAMPDQVLGYCSLPPPPPPQSGGNGAQNPLSLAGALQRTMMNEPQALASARPSRFVDGSVGGVGDELKSIMGEPIPFRQLVSSSSLSTIGARFNSNSASGSSNLNRNTHTLARLNVNTNQQLQQHQQDHHQQQQAMRACYAATLGKQQQHHSTFVGGGGGGQHQPLKYNNNSATDSPLYGRLQQHKQLAGEQDQQYGSFRQQELADFNQQQQQQHHHHPVSSDGTSGYATSNSIKMNSSEINEQPVYLQTLDSYHLAAAAANIYGGAAGGIAESHLYDGNQRLSYDTLGQQSSVVDGMQRYSAYSISGNDNKATDCGIDSTHQLISGAYGMIFGTDQQANKLPAQNCNNQIDSQQQQQQLEPQELAHRLQILTNNHRQQDNNINNN